MRRFNFWHFHQFCISQYRKGLLLARGPSRCGAQFGLIGQIGLKPALFLCEKQIVTAIAENNSISVCVYGICVLTKLAYRSSVLTTSNATSSILRVIVRPFNNNFFCFSYFKMQLILEIYIFFMNRLSLTSCKRSCCCKSWKVGFSKQFGFSQEVKMLLLRKT